MVELRTMAAGLRNPRRASAPRLLRTLGWLALPALITSGCAGLLPTRATVRDVPVYWASPSDIDQVRRVLVLPFDTAPEVDADVTGVHRAVVEELAKMQRFELVRMDRSNDIDQAILESMRHGRISLEALSELVALHHVDGVLLGTVTSYRPYKPPRLGLRVQILSTHSAAPVWAVETFYDSGDAAVIEDLQHFAASFAASDANEHGWEFALISPQRFAGFVAHRVVGTWREASWF